MLDGFWTSVVDQLPEPLNAVLGWSATFEMPVVVYWDKLANEFKSAETRENVLVVTHWMELPSKPMGV